MLKNFAACHVRLSGQPCQNMFVCMRGRFLILPEMKFQADLHPLQEIQVDIEGQAITERETASIHWFLKEVRRLQSIMCSFVNTSYSFVCVHMRSYFQKGESILS